MPADDTQLVDPCRATATHAALLARTAGASAATRMTERFRAIASTRSDIRRSTRGVARGAGLLDWARALLPAHFTLPPSPMHRWLEQQLADAHRRRGTKINLVGPRGGAKSTVGTLAYVLRAAVEGWEPYVWIVSDTRHQACAHLENVKSELTDNALLAALYPSAAGHGPKWQANGIALANGVTIEAFGTGQRIRGRRRRAHRPTLIVCDDLQNDRHALSPTQRERSRHWFHAALMQAGTPRTNVVNLATALHREALALELDRTAGWTSRIFKAVESWPENTSLWQDWERRYTDFDNPDRKRTAREFYEQHRAALDAGGQVLWPEAEDLYTLMCIRVESGRTAFEREKQSSPVNPELCEWPESYFGDHIWFDEWPRRLHVKTMALDPSKGHDARHGDYSAFVMLGVDPRGVMYVQADMARRPTPQIVADGVALFRQFQPDAFGIEANQFQDLLGADFEAEMRQQGLLGVRPWTIDNRVNKQVRIRRLAPYFSSRRIQFKSGCASTRMLVEQFKDFPIADHDDGPDAAEMAVRLASAIVQGQAATDGLGDRLVLDV
jgi:predicted phage terminase large subunit-like protein